MTEQVPYGCLPAKPAIEDRNIRQRDIVSPEKLVATTAYVVGTGAIGRQVALQLAAIGVGTLVLIDPDRVGPENLAVQGFLESDLEQQLSKVTAVEKLCRAINHEITVGVSEERFKRKTLSEWGSGIVFSCVDSMESRKFIWTACRGKCTMLVDGRMAAEVCRVLTLRRPQDWEYYESTLFDDMQAYQATCTAKSTLYCANIAAGFMVSQLSKLYRNMSYDRDVQINILANEMRVEDQRRPAAADRSVIA